MKHSKGSYLIIFIININITTSVDIQKRAIKSYSLM